MSKVPQHGNGSMEVTDQSPSLKLNGSTLSHLLEHSKGLSLSYSSGNDSIKSKKTAKLREGERHVGKTHTNCGGASLHL